VTDWAATPFTSVRFVDTNVLLYGVSRDPLEQNEAARAREILAEDDLALSVQVLQEFYVQATRPSGGGALSHEDAVFLVEAFQRFPIQETTLSLMRTALTTRRRFGISYWDAAILEAARSLGCDVVLSEDLSDETDYDGIRVENPFR
jgi:predicted nucleic acid-binding protein